MAITPACFLFVKRPDFVKLQHVVLSFRQDGGRLCRYDGDQLIERHSTPESCLFAAVPESILKLINLTHLYLNGTGISSALDFVIERRYTSDSG